ncbi:MAG TPA: phosphotransferase [Candidatus Paceibacterota bacterium]|nr:phosphotransferase [Candidatus Paceibacterota bacterium]
MKRPTKFLQATKWKAASVRPLTGDASARRYFRLQEGDGTAILMDASRVLEMVAPFVQINLHLDKLGFSVPDILARDDENGFLLLEDFGDATFSHLLENNFDAEQLFSLATDVLIALHKHPKAVQVDLRSYHPQKMLEDVELFLEGHPVSEKGKAEFRTVWLDVLPLAHDVPSSLLLRDYHVANLMLLPEREGVRHAGLLDFQDAYQGPVTYDLISLLEDARRDLPPSLKEKMLAHYISHFPNLDRKTFETSLAILAALRHTRVLAVFEKLSREGKPDYKELHSPRVERLLQEALKHPELGALEKWFAKYAR